LVAAAAAGWLIRRSRLSIAVALVALLLALGLCWLFPRGDSVPALTFAGRAWMITPITRQLTGIALLLGLTAGIHALLNDSPPTQNRRAFAVTALSAAALPTLWAADERTRVLGLAFFVLVWALISHGGRPPAGDARGDFRPALRLAAALLPLWLAGAMPALAAPSTLLAAAVLLGLWPLGERRGGGYSDPAVALLLDALPVVIGAALLGAAAGAPAAEAMPPATAASLVVGALSLLSVAAGQIQFRLSSPGDRAGALRLGLVGVLSATVLWAGEEALFSAVRLAVFAPALMMLAENGAETQPSPAPSVGRFPSPRLVAAVVVFVSLSGLPLTVGFETLAHLYDGWQAAGGWLLVGVTVLLLGFWLAALYSHGRAATAGPAARNGWPRRAAMVLPVAGLAAFHFSPPTAPLTWVALAASLLIGLLLGLFVSVPEAVDDLLRESLALPPSASPIVGRARRFGHAAAEAVDEALAILEGEYGLLWLLGLAILLLWLARTV
jgi:hypothetical protein